MINAPAGRGKITVPRAEELVGKRIIVTNPPSEEEIVIQIVPDKEAEPAEGKIAPGAPLVKFLQEKEVGEEYDFLANKELNTLPVRYKIIRVDVRLRYVV